MSVKEDQMETFDEYLEEQLKDPEFKKAWDELEPEHQVKRAQIKMIQQAERLVIGCNPYYYDHMLGHEYCFACRRRKEYSHEEFCPFKLLKDAYREYQKAVKDLQEDEDG